MRVILAFLLMWITKTQCPEGGAYFYGLQKVNCTCLEVYTKRFRIDSIIFNSTIGVDAQQNVVVNISFSDCDTDPTINLDNNYSCIQPVFQKYEINFAGTPTVHAPTIVSTYNQQTGCRIWSYSISPANFQTDLIEGTSSQALLNYAGYFGIDFIAVGDVQATYQYTFTIQVNRQTSATAIDQFSQLLIRNNIQTRPIYSTVLLQFCSSSTCEAPTNAMNLAFNQNYWLYLSITNSGLNQYLLKNPVITILSGNNLVRQDTPVDKQVNVTAGKTIISRTVNFAYSNVVIGVSAQFFPPGTRRILAACTKIPPVTLMTAYSHSIDCIRYSSTNRTCVSCADQCKANNGGANADCPACDASNMNSALLSIAMILILIFTY